MSETDLNDKNPKLLQNFSGVRLKAIHPKGYIIFGRNDISFSEDGEQKHYDFELIRNMYSDVIDIITFDDLLDRINRIITHLQSQQIQ
ncbi:hypothetical protein SDC9_208904 [bioreactor metagenome]|uniref:Shedu protein SduA C-terminal domain-containing protein n=1 Tax=bioreactor metagenome TaxID=1076179 RepID=A0A645JDL6_9ZZZZ